MNQLIKAISINPTNRTIEEVQIEANNLSAFYKHIGCHTIDFVCRMPNGDALIVDERWDGVRLVNQTVYFYKLGEVSKENAMNRLLHLVEL